MIALLLLILAAMVLWFAASFALGVLIGKVVKLANDRDARNMLERDRG